MTQSNENPPNSNKERASALGSKASVTIEAALAVPVFLFAVLSLVYLLEIQSVRTCIRSAVQSAAKTAAEDTVMLPVVNLVKFRQDIVEAAGADRLDRSILAGGSSGLNLSRTYMSVLTGEIHVSVEYAVRLPLPQFTNLKAKFREEMRVKAWTGYSKKGWKFRRRGDCIYHGYGFGLSRGLPMYISAAVCPVCAVLRTFRDPQRGRR